MDILLSEVLESLVADRLRGTATPSFATGRESDLKRAYSAAKRESASGPVAYRVVGRHSAMAVSVSCDAQVAKVSVSGSGAVLAEVSISRSKGDGGVSYSAAVGGDRGGEATPFGIIVLDSFTDRLVSGKLDALSI